jgi:hypothetical protein
MSSRRMARLMMLLQAAGTLQRDDRHRVVSAILYRNVESFKDLTDIEIEGTVAVLEHWERQGELQERCRACGD